MVAKQRQKEIKSLLKQHNISYGLLSQHLNRSISSLRAEIHNRRGLSQEKYLDYLTAINEIKLLSKEEIYQKYIRGEIKAPKKFSTKNIDEVREKMDKRGVRRSDVARVLGYTPFSFNSLLNVANQRDISDEQKQNILEAIEKLKNNNGV